ncbi:MAG: MFS transporter [Peptoniphilaceae bacterium]|nr:MFS transporter [Peptoniphilaceae bacterium]MDY6085484.1 MFS transporter [Peptoniphilaceae bacterium]
MRDRTLFRQNAFLQISFFIGFGILSIYSVLFLQKAGYSTLEIGIATTLANLLGTLVQLYTGRLADRARGLSIKAILLAQSVTMAVVMLPYFGGMPSLAVVFVTYLIYCGLAQAVQGPMNAVTVAFEKAGHAIPFNIIRGLGSMSYGVTSVLTGFYFDSQPIEHLPYFLFASSFLFSIAILMLPKPPTGGQQLADDRIRRTGKATEHFYAKYPVFVPLIIGFTLLFAGHVMINNYLALIVENRGGGPGQTGLAVAVAISCEVLALFSFTAIRRKLSDRTILFTSAFTFTLKAFLLYLSKNVAMIFVSQILQFGGFAFFTAGMSYFAAQLVEPQDLVKGQSVNTIIMSLGGAMGSFVGGFALHILSVNQSLLLTVGVSLVGTIVAVAGLVKAGKVAAQKAR